MSAEATGFVWRHSPYKGVQLLVHLAIADVVNDAHDNEFWMSTYSLASKARVGRSTVVATLSDMQKRGLLDLVESGRDDRKPTRYRFTGPSGDLARPSWPSPLGQDVATELLLNPNERPKSTRSLGDLANVDCPECFGHGAIYDSAGAFKSECHCARRSQLKSVAPLAIVEGA